MIKDRTSFLDKTPEDKEEEPVAPVTQRKQVEEVRFKRVLANRLYKEKERLGKTPYRR